MYDNGFDVLRGDYAHNTFLEIGPELDLVGLMFLPLLVFSIFKTDFNGLREVFIVYYLLAVTSSV